MNAKAIDNNQIRYIGNQGRDDQNACLDPELPCASLERGIFVADEGDTLNIAEGIYTESNLTIDKNIKFKGEGSELSIVQAAELPATASHRVITIAKDATVEFEDIAIRHGKTPDGSGFKDTAGGGLFNEGITTLNRCLVSHNQTGSGNSIEFDELGHGGGIYNLGTLMLNGTTLSHNQTSDNDDGTSGGGLYNYVGATALIYNCTISDNTVAFGQEDSGSGAGILNLGTLTIHNSTISKNTTKPIGSGGGGSAGGGILNTSSGTIDMDHCTIVENTARLTGGGISNFGEINMKHSILAKNICPVGPDCAGEINSEGYNLVSDTKDCSVLGELTGLLLDVDPLLGPLQDNGGPTLTHLPLTGSPVIDAGDPEFMQDPTTDQTGQPRVMGARIDLGAVEVQRLSFIAYNDFSWSEGQRMENITRYTTQTGAGDPPDGSEGNLINFKTGEPLDVTFTVTGGSWNGIDHATTKGSSAVADTDAWNFLSRNSGFNWSLKLWQF